MARAVVLLVALLAVLCAPLAAFAQTACTDTWRFRPNSFEAVLTGDVCVAESARLAVSGFSLANCTVTGGVLLSYTMLDASSSVVYNPAEWDRLPLGCSAGEAPPPEPAASSASAATSADVAAARDGLAVILLSGIAVVAFGLGFIGGFQR